MHCSKTPQTNNNNILSSLNNLDTNDTLKTQENDCLLNAKSENLLEYDDKQ